MFQTDQIDEYTMVNIEEELHLDRPKLLAMAVLLGCDYYPGVQGVGKEKATTFLKHYNDGDAVDRYAVKSISLMIYHRFDYHRCLSV